MVDINTHIIIDLITSHEAEDAAKWLKIISTRKLTASFRVNIRVLPDSIDFCVIVQKFPCKYPSFRDNNRLHSLPGFPCSYLPGTKTPSESKVIAPGARPIPIVKIYSQRQVLFILTGF